MTARACLTAVLNQYFLINNLKGNEEGKGINEEPLKSKRKLNKKYIVVNKQVFPASKVVNLKQLLRDTTWSHTFTLRDNHNSFIFSSNQSILRQFESLYELYTTTKH